MFAVIQTTRTCLTVKALRVTGGPVFPQQSPSSPDGELIAGDRDGGAFIAFYTDASKAQRLEPDIRRNASRFRGLVERQGAVTVLWIHQPASSLRRAVLACAFA
jgi:hypothetical protein